MPHKKQFYVFHSGGDFSSDQLALIHSEIRLRRQVVKQALINLQIATSRLERSVKTVKKPVSKRKPTAKKIVKKPSATKLGSNNSNDKKALKGRVSYKVKGPDGRLMNIAEIKNWVDSIYDGKQGIIKQ